MESKFAVAEFVLQDEGVKRLVDAINTTRLNDVIHLTTEASEDAAGGIPRARYNGCQAEGEKSNL